MQLDDYVKTRSVNLSGVNNNLFIQRVTKENYA
jgi:hypothetical protein